jgi:hypothetical protein
MAEHLENEHEWRTFELYEKIRVKERRKKLVVIVLTMVLFLSLCAVPVVQERMPKWISLHAAQRLSVEFEKLKILAIEQKRPIRVTFLVHGVFQVEVLNDCRDATGTVLFQKSWTDPGDTLQILSSEAGKEYKIAYAANTLCFDPVHGLENPKRVVVIAPVKDLAELPLDQRLERASYVVLETESAKISIN